MTLPAYAGISAAGSETSIPWPVGHAAGDFGILVIEHSNVVTPIPAPSGWIAFPGSPVDPAGTFGVLLGFWYRFATSGAEADVAPGGTVNHKWGTIVTYTGVNIATPFHAVATAYWAPAQTLIAMPGITTLLDDCMIVNLLAWANDDAGPLGSAPTNAALGSVSERYDGGTITAGGGGVYIWDGTLATHGTFGPSTVTMSSAAIAALAVLALCPADKVLPTQGRESRVKNTGAM